jgi:RNA polymerase sigma-70 factor (ECF subfamily)
MKNERVNKEASARDALQDNSRGSFELLFKTFYAPLCDYTRAILGDSSEAEDVVQDLFTHLWKHKEEVNIHGPARSYLYASARYRALNVLKHRLVMKKNSPLLVDFIENIQQDGYSEEEEQKIEKINEVLASLPPQCRAVFTMSCLDGKKYKEIALELDISVNTVKFHVTRAYREIRSAIGTITGSILLLLAIKEAFHPRCRRVPARRE